MIVVDKGVSLQKFSILAKGKPAWLLTLVSCAVFGHVCLYSNGKGAWAEEPPPPANVLFANTLSWVTASEIDNFGFDVYRSESSDGLFTRVTKTPVPGAGTRDESSTYVYTDATIKPDVEYYYYVESISMSGQREKFTPTFKAPIKPSKSARPAAAQVYTQEP